MELKILTNIWKCKQKMGSIRYVCNVYNSRCKETFLLCMTSEVFNLTEPDDYNGNIIPYDSKSEKFKKLKYTYLEAKPHLTHAQLKQWVTKFNNFSNCVKFVI